MYTAIVKTIRTEYSKSGQLVEIGAMTFNQKASFTLMVADMFRAHDDTIIAYSFDERVVKITARTVRELDRLAWLEVACQENEYNQVSQDFCSYATVYERIT